MLSRPGVFFACATGAFAAVRTLSSRGARGLSGASVASSSLPLFRYMVIDADGRRIGRFESSEAEWRPGDTFDLEGRGWRIVEILPEVSTMVAYNAVWVAAPITP